MAISADNENELVETAIQHGIFAHGLHNGQEFIEELKIMIKEGSPSS